MLAEHHQRRIEIIAYLYCSQSSVRESKVAKDLGYSRARVAEDLGIAKKRGLVVQERRFVPDRMFDPGRITTLHLVGQSNRLRAHLRQTCDRLQSVSILDSGAEMVFPQRLIRMGSLAGPVVYEFLHRATCVGVAWGGTLGAIVEGLRGHSRPAKPRKPIEFVPICGEPLRAPRRINSATSLALDLDAIVNGVPQNSRSLAGVPALIPRRFYDTGDVAVIKRFFEEATDFGSIFGSSEGGNRETRDAPIIDRMDMILTSVGTASDHWRMCDVELQQEAGGISKKEFSNLVFGDLGGVLMPKPNLDTFEKEQVDFLSQQWTGIRREHYERVAGNCGGQEAPGVVVAAIASNKAEAAYQAIKSRLINHLICDHDLAQALADVSGAPVLRAEASAYVSGQ